MRCDVMCSVLTGEFPFLLVWIFLRSTLSTLSYDTSNIHSPQPSEIIYACEKKVTLSCCRYAHLLSSLIHFQQHRRSLSAKKKEEKRIRQPRNSRKSFKVKTRRRFMLCFRRHEHKKLLRLAEVARYT